MIYIESWRVKNKKKEQYNLGVCTIFVGAGGIWGWKERFAGGYGVEKKDLQEVMGLKKKDSLSL